MSEAYPSAAANWTSALSPKNARIVLLLACSLLLLQSVVFLQTRWVEDESWLSEGAWNVAQEGRLHMKIFPSDSRFQADVGVPFQRLTMAASFKAFGLGVVQARMPSILFGIGMVIVTFLLALEWAGPLGAAIAAIVVATDNFVIVTSRTARPETHTGFLCWLTVLLCVLSIRKRSDLLAFFSGLAGGLALFCHPLGVPFVIGAGIFYLHEHGSKALVQRSVWLFALGVLLVMGPYAAWCFSDADHIASFRGIYLAKANEPIHERIYGEAARWADFIGLTSQRVQLPVRIPMRLHIAIGLILAFALFFRVARKQAAALLILLALNIGWWLYLVNKGPRYLALIAPLFAVLLGALAAYTRARRTKIAVFALIGLIVLTQMAGNAYWVYKYRIADYPEVTRQLRAIIPPGASVYSITTFWMALNDRTYYAYDRTRFDYAVRELKPQYMILYDRVMVSGSGQGNDDFKELRENATQFVRRHGELAGKVSNPFYGDLEVYRVTYD